jgi:6,7-dimethyl-8-ribityllumazine synthase
MSNDHDEFPRREGTGSPDPDGRSAAGEDGLPSEDDSPPEREPLVEPDEPEPASAAPAWTVPVTIAPVSLAPSGAPPIEPAPVAVPPADAAPVEPAPALSAPIEAAPASEPVPSEADPADPFAGWPQPETGEVIEDIPDEGGSVEHVSGEIDVPAGYTVLEGTPTGHRRSVAIVVARFNGGLTNRMLARAIEALEEAGVSPDAVTVVPVPGAFELPLAAIALAKTRRYACVVALGAIVRGETPHFDYVASETASGLQLAAIETGIPVAFGVLTVDTVEQGEARVDRAADSVRTALEMADIFAQLRASAGGG